MASSERPKIVWNSFSLLPFPFSLILPLSSSPDPVHGETREQYESLREEGEEEGEGKRRCTFVPGSHDGRE